MTESIDTRIINAIQSALSEKSGLDLAPVTIHDSMETIDCWDSLAFMSVYLAINEEFGLNPDFDDAVHYTSVQALSNFLKKRAA